MFFAFCLAILGLIFIYLEFFLPGWILGLCGGILLFFSMGVVVFNKTDPLTILLFMLLLPMLVIATCHLAIKQIKRSKRKNSFYLNEDQEGFQANTLKKEFIGKRASVLTDLKPSGYILVDGETVQALSLTGYINKDSKVLIIDGKGGHFIVKKIEI